MVRGSGRRGKEEESGQFVHKVSSQFLYVCRFPWGERRIWFWCRSSRRRDGRDGSAVRGELAPHWLPQQVFCSCCAAGERPDPVNADPVSESRLSIADIFLPPLPPAARSLPGRSAAAPRTSSRHWFTSCARTGRRISSRGPDAHTRLRVTCVTFRSDERRHRTGRLWHGIGFAGRNGGQRRGVDQGLGGLSGGVLRGAGRRRRRAR